jgi:predicted HNH restriction endonuclease
MTEEDKEFLKGKIAKRLPTFKERNSSASKSNQVIVLKTGKLEYQVPGFDSTEHYGYHGKGFTECYHSKPLDDPKVTNVENLLLLWLLYE